MLDFHGYCMVQLMQLARHVNEILCVFYDLATVCQH